MPRLRLALPALLLAAAAGAAVPVACSKAPENTSVDAVSDSRLTDLEAKVRDLTSENEEARRALGVSGTERGSLSRAVGDMREEIRRLKEQMAAGGGAASAMSDGTSTASTTAAGSTSAGSTPPGDGLAGGSSTTADYTPTEAEVNRADAIMKAVEKRRQEEQEKKRLREVLAQAEVNLSPEQEATVLKLNREFTEKRNELMKTLGGRVRGTPQTDADRNEFRAKIEELQAEHETALRNALPSADAERVITAVKQSYPGFFRRDGNNRPRGGMGGG